jgi:hypothetical protein
VSCWAGLGGGLAIGRDAGLGRPRSGFATVLCVAPRRWKARFDQQPTPACQTVPLAGKKAGKAGVIARGLKPWTPEVSRPGPACYIAPSVRIP